MISLDCRLLPISKCLTTCFLPEHHPNHVLGPLIPSLQPGWPSLCCLNIPSPCHFTAWALALPSAWHASSFLDSLIDGFFEPFKTAHRLLLREIFPDQPTYGSFHQLLLNTLTYFTTIWNEPDHLFINFRKYLSLPAYFLPVIEAAWDKVCSLSSFTIVNSAHGTEYSTVVK